MLRQHPRRLHHGRDPGTVIVRAGRIGGRVHHVGDAAVDMPWMMTTSLGRSVPRWIATMSRLVSASGCGRRLNLGRIDDGQAIAARGGIALEPPA